MNLASPSPRPTLFRDLSQVSGRSLEQTVERFGRIASRIPNRRQIGSHIVLDSIAEIEAELIAREIDRGRSLGPSCVA